MHQFATVDNPAHIRNGTGTITLSVGPIEHPRYILDWSVDRFLISAALEYKDIGLPEHGLCAVYVIRTRDAEWCKIGITDKPKARLAALQTGHWDELLIHAVMWVWDNRARELEALCHLVAAQAGYEVRREWVRLSPADALGLVLTNAEALGIAASGSTAIWHGRTAGVRDEAQTRKAERLREAQLKAARQGY